MADPVLIHVANARAAGQRRHVDPADILAILSVEGGTSPTGAPVAPADGLGPPSYGQFITSTGRKLGVVYGSSASETDAIARYLNELGYQSDRRVAFAKYNGGPANPQYSYADKVIDRAKHYTGLDTRPTSSTRPATTSTRDASSPPGLVDQDKRSGALRALLWVTAVISGAVLVALGATRAFGLRAPQGAPA